MRILLLASTTGYQTRSFAEAAVRQGIDVTFATDRCHALDNPWRDGAIPIRFHDEPASVAAILAAVAGRPVDGVLALGDRPTVIAARVAGALGLNGHPAVAAEFARNKALALARWAYVGLRVPWFRIEPLGADARALAAEVEYPCVVKPLSLSASRGVIRADDPAGFVAAFDRVRRLLGRRSIRSMRDPAADRIIVEGFIPGPEFAVEAVLEGGALRPIAIFDKPDPLDGPFFEETIYVTPSRRDRPDQDAMLRAVERAASALGLHHGPVHAECRVNTQGIFVLEVAARPIGGLCARVLRFGSNPGTSDMTLEDVLLRHAAGDSVETFHLDARAAGVMMVPIPRRGFYKGVAGVDAATVVPGIEEIRITAKTDQLLEPIPEGSSYLGFIFARAERPDQVEASLRTAHARLEFSIQDAPAMVLEGTES
jgi:hypothetical protein